MASAKVELRGAATDEAEEALITAATAGLLVPSIVGTFLPRLSIGSYPQRSYLFLVSARAVRLSNTQIAFCSHCSGLLRERARALPPLINPTFSAQS